MSTVHPQSTGRFVLTALFALALAAPAGAVTTTKTAAAKSAKPAASHATAVHAAAKGKTPAVHALSRADLDTTCAPCQDFNRFANGGWIARHPIPPSSSAWGSFSELTERNQEILHGILERDAKKAKASPDGAKDDQLGSYWCACMDSTSTGGMKDVTELIRMDPPSTTLAQKVAQLHEHGMGVLFSFRSAQDPRNSDAQIAHVGPGALGLPDRDYYVRNDSAGVATRTRYLAHVAKLLELGKASPGDPHAAAQSVLDLETGMAKASMTNVQRRDPYATYHKVSVDSLARLCPSFAWKEYFDARGITALDSVNVTEPEYLKALDGWLKSGTSGAAIPTYFASHVLHNAAPMLGPELASEDFDFNRVLQGAPEQQPRWKRCVRWADRDLGDLLGKEYIAQEFPPAARERALAMVHDLEAALGDRIQSLDWMGPETRRRALDKLHAFTEQIGYPSTMRDYAGVTIGCSPGQSLLTNHYACVTWEAKRNMAKIGKPVDRGEWGMTPPTVNAFYSSSLNSINFPAGILQPPFFDPKWDDAVNYGAIGAVIGHEMSHGFDDHGRQFDGRGNLTDWWTPEDAAKYKERADRVVNQFNSYTVLDTLHVNGRLTLGEDIGDLGGVAVAYHALEKALARHPVGKIDGFTPQQRFFLAYARVWASSQRPAALRTQVLTNPHAPAKWRANGPLSNLPEFREAWGCKEGDPMVRPEGLRARIW